MSQEPISITKAVEIIYDTLMRINADQRASVLKSVADLFKIKINN